MADNWGAGFATGMAVGGGSGKTETEVYYVPDLNAEHQLIEERAVMEGLMAVRLAMHDVIVQLSPDHPLVARPDPGAGTIHSPAAKKIFNEAYDRITTTGLDTDPYLRKICPGLVKIRDAERAQEAAERARAETARVKAEHKAANPGFFARMMGAGKE